MIVVGEDKLQPRKCLPGVQAIEGRREGMKGGREGGREGGIEAGREGGRSDS